MMLYVEWCDLGCKQVGLKSFMVSIDYRDYMGSSSKIWALRCLFLYLCSYNLVGSVTSSASGSPRIHPSGLVAATWWVATGRWRTSKATTHPTTWLISKVLWAACLDFFNSVVHVCIVNKVNWGLKLLIILAYFYGLKFFEVVYISNNILDVLFGASRVK
jgi:hypothetical protein